MSLALPLCGQVQLPDVYPPRPGGVQALRDLEYARVGNKSLLLDLYLPESGQGPRPVIVWVHGGAWRGGDKRGHPIDPITSHGYALASINYRLSHEAIFPAQIEDCKAAIRWLRAHAKEYKLDPNHIGAWGASAGGHLVALLGTSGGMKELEGAEGNLGYSSLVQAVVDWFGPTDFLQIEAHARPDRKWSHEAPDSPESRLIGGPVQENKDRARKANPITYVTKDAPPFLIMHGDQDPIVPLHQSQLLYDALNKAGVDATLLMIPGAGHGGRDFTQLEILKRVLDFFDKHLKKDRP